MKNKKLFFLSCHHCMIGLFFLLFLNACVISGGVSVGGLQSSLEVEEIFRSATLLPDHTYYIQGPAADPEAIIAVRNTWQLRSRLWSRVKWTGKELKDAVFWMQIAEIGFCTTDGGYLTAPGGIQVGVWYSQRELAIIKEPEPGVIEIYPFDFMYGSPCHRQHRLDEL